MISKRGEKKKGGSATAGSVLFKRKNQTSSNRPDLDRIDDSADEDPDTTEIATHCAHQLDQLLSSSYDFVEVQEESQTAKEPILQVNEVNHTVLLYTPSSVTEQDSSCPPTKRIPWKPKPKFAEKISEEDLASVAVSGDWVLSKKGVYLTGRQRRSEVITGAVHAPSLKKPPANKN